MTALMIESAVRALLFALVVGGALRLFRVRHVPARKAAWSLVLMASLAMPFLMRSPAVAGWEARWGWAVPVPALQEDKAPAADATAAGIRNVPEVLAATAPEAPQDLRHGDDAAALTPDSVSTAMDATALVAERSAAGRGASKLHWPPADRLIVMMYLGVAGVLLVRLLWGLAIAWRLWATADRVSPLTAPEPNVRSSERIASPVTIGWGIVLPANYAEWDRKKLRMVLAHERSHVRQMDFYLQLLAGLYTAMFWFSPLGWWLRRTLASLGEAIGDRAGMDAAASGSRYAEVLLEFAVLPRQTLPGVAMARPGNLSHRVERVLNEQLFRRAFAEGRRRAVVSLFLIPAALFAATVLIRVPGAAAQTAPQTPAVPAPVAALAPPSEVAAAAPAAPALPAAPGSEGQTVPANAPEVPTAPRVPGVPTPAVAPRAPATGVPPAPAMAPLPPVPPEEIDADDSADALVSDDDQKRTGYTYGVSNDGESWAIVDGPRNEVTFTGRWDNERRAEIDAARKTAKGPFLWFTHEGKSYIVTDPAAIARVRAMDKPVEPLGRQREALGKQQEALGRQMEELERQQEAAARVKIPDLSREIAAMDTAMAKANEDREKLNIREIAEAEAKIRAAQDQTMTPEKLSELQANLSAAQAAWNSGSMAEMQAKLGEMQARLGELQGEAGARQGDFAAKMGALGAQQGRLGAEQGHLGAEQGRIAHQADRQVREMIEQSLRDGTATPVPR